MAQRKETKKNVKVRDLKPRKDAKGGVMADVSTQTRQQNVSIQQRGTQGGRTANRFI